MLNSEKINEIFEKIGIDPADLPDDLTGTKLKSIAVAAGADEDSFPDALYSTFLRTACELEGVDLSSLDNPFLYGELLDALVESAHPLEPSDSSLVGTGTVGAMIVGTEDAA